MPIPPHKPGHPPFALLIGLRILSATPDRVEAEMTASPDLMNGNGMLHGGAIMALADNVGGVGAFLNVPPGYATTTIESKTNFFRGIHPGDLVRAVGLPLHKGNTTSVWQTTITRSDGKVAAMVTQTQMTIILRKA